MRSTVFDEERVGFLTSVELKEAEGGPDLSKYPFCIPAVAALSNKVRLHPQATFFVGDNGAGKSTLIEGIAVAAGFNAEGGSQHFNFSSRRSHSELHRYLRLVRPARRPVTGYFLRAESFFNVATNIEAMDRVQAIAPLVIASYGGRSLHEQSHGESFMALALHRFGPHGLYILDEPEAALHPNMQLALLRRIRDLVRQGCQFIVATHSPILMALPEAQIYVVSASGIQSASYEDTEHYKVTKTFFEDHRLFLRELFADDP